MEYGQGGTIGVGWRFYPFLWQACHDEVVTRPQGAQIYTRDEATAQIRAAGKGSINITITVTYRPLNQSAQEA